MAVAIESWERAARAALDAGEPAALVSILATEGSAPRGAGTRMLVTRAAIAGTIGGGALEHQAIAQARALLDHSAGSWRVQDYPLGPLLGQCCGGRVRLLVERLAPQARDWIGASGVLATRFEPDALVRTIEDTGLMAATLPARGPRPSPGDRIVERLGADAMPVLMFGAGHVGRAVARAVDGLPLALSWFDTRADAAETPGVALVEEDHVESCARDAPPGSALLIMTHDHGLDYRLTATALRSPARFIGLIGSATKRARFLGRLERDGFDAAARARLTCPIGVEGVTGKAPAVIAIAVAAQLMQLHGSAA